MALEVSVEKTLRSLYAQYKIVTFDIFDTLVHRKVRAPVDVFEMVRLKAFEIEDSWKHHDTFDRFPDDRILAENLAREKRRADSVSEGEVTFDEIYESFAKISLLPIEIVKKLKSLELSFEEQVLFPSSEGLKHLVATQAAGCRIAFLSDMYLPSDWIYQTLIKKGFPDIDTVPIYISGEHRFSKHSGALYANVAEQLGWSAGTHWLHVGDNLKADIDQAKSFGIQTKHADWAEVDNRLKRPEKCSFPDTLITSLTDAIVLPQTRHRLPESRLERIGYTIYGPFLFGFLIFLLCELRARQLERVLFISRDGWLPFKLFELLEGINSVNGIDARYFYMSRASGYLTGIRSWDDAQTRLLFNGKSSRKPKRILELAGLRLENYENLFLEQGLDPNEEYTRSRDHRKILGIVDALHMDILKESSQRQQRFSEYYDATVSNVDRVGFVDIGWHGNVQRGFIHSITDANAQKKIHGLYVGLHKTGRERNLGLGLNMTGWLNTAPDYDDKLESLLAGGVELLEFVLTTDHGTTIGLEQTGDGIKPVLEIPAEQEMAYQAYAAEAQKGVFSFVQDHLWLLHNYQPETLNSTAWAHPFFRMVSRPTLQEAEALGRLTHSDSPGTTAERYDIVHRLRGLERFYPHARSKARARSYWKAGFDRLNPKLWLKA